MLISIIIPVYKVENYLEQCIESVISQYNHNFEVILIDDGSPDHCPQMCDAYSRSYPFIKTIHQKNQGLSVARNSGIMQAQGKYCLFLDSDDWLEQGAIASVERLLSSGENPEVIVNRIKIYSEDQNSLSECKYHFDTLKLSKLSVPSSYDHINSLPGFWGAAWMFIVRTDNIIKNELLFAPGIFHEDEDWVPRIFLTAKLIAYNNECPYCLRINRKDSITQIITPKHEMDKLWIIRHLMDEMNNGRYNLEAKKSINLRCCKLYCGIMQKTNSYRYSYPNEFSIIISSLIQIKSVLIKYYRPKYFLLWALITCCGIKRAVRLVQKG